MNAQSPKTSMNVRSVKVYDDAHNQHQGHEVAIVNHAASEVVFPPLHPDTFFQPCGFFL